MSLALRDCFQLYLVTDSLRSVVRRNGRRFPWWEREEESSIRHGTNIHGEYRLPSGYFLCIVPSNAPLTLARDGSNQIVASGASVVDGVPMLASSYNAVKLIIGLVQAIWAVITLYRARGNQIDEYGYAAFGLTVAPYAWMSFVNVIATLSCPNYPAMFMIRTGAMDQAEQAGGSFSGELRVTLDQNESINDRCWIESRLVVLSLTWFLAIAPIIIVGGLSRLTAGNSTSIERGFTLSWLVIGAYCGVHFSGFQTRFFPTDERRPTRKSLIWDFAVFLCLQIPAVGGMVVVGMMLHKFGECTRFS